MATSSTCASTLLALHIETALKSSLIDRAGLVSRTRIDTVMKFLRSFYPSWSNLKWTLRLFEVVVSRTGLSLTSTDGPSYDAKLSNPFYVASSAIENYLPKNGDKSNPDGVNGDSLPIDSISRTLFPESEEYPSTVMGHSAEDWLQDLFNVNFYEMEQGHSL